MRIPEIPESAQNSENLRLSRVCSDLCSHCAMLDRMISSATSLPNIDDCVGRDLSRTDLSDSFSAPTSLQNKSDLTWR